MSGTLVLVSYSPSHPFCHGGDIGRKFVRIGGRFVGTHEVIVQCVVERFHVFLALGARFLGDNLVESGKPDNAKNDSVLG